MTDNKPEEKEKEPLNVGYIGGRAYLKIGDLELGSESLDTSRLCSLALWLMNHKKIRDYLIQIKFGELQKIGSAYG